MMLNTSIACKVYGKIALAQKLNNNVENLEPVMTL